MAELRQQSGAPDRPMILLADDEHAIREALSQFLHRAGFDVLEAGTGDRALELAQTRVVDLCVLDVLMPGLDGREVLRRLRRAGSFTPVLLLTQVGDAGERAMALEEGADDYLNKPFDPHELVARVRAILRRSDRGAPSLTASSVLRSGALRLDRLARSRRTRRTGTTTRRAGRRIAGSSPASRAPDRGAASAGPGCRQLSTANASSATGEALVLVTSMVWDRAARGPLT